MRTKPVLAALLFGLGALAAPGAVEAFEDAPKAPFDLQARSKFDGGTAVAVLTWRDQSDNELGFEVLRSDNREEYKVVGIVGANTTHYDDKIGKYITGAFRYQVRAFNEAGKSEPSKSASVWF